MSRHRDVRCMNYSDEYDGYDDIYGHSVEDDYCVSPSAEQFLFDRSKQQNIASFITEPDIVEGNEDGEEPLTPPNDKTIALTDSEKAKLMSCMETIKNIIGEAVPESELKEKIIKSGFNTEIALDSILKESSPKTATESKAINRDSVEHYTGAATTKPQPTSFTIPKLSFQKRDNLAESTNMNSSLSNTLEGLKKLAVSNSPTSFSSLSAMIANHTKSASPSFVKAQPKTDSRDVSFGSLADLTAHHLQKSNSQNENTKVNEKSFSPNANFVIPKLSIKRDQIGDVNNTQSGLPFSVQRSANIPSTSTKPREECNLRRDLPNFVRSPENVSTKVNSKDRPSKVGDSRTPSPDGWIIDLSTALKETDSLNTGDSNKTTLATLTNVCGNVPSLDLYASDEDNGMSYIRLPTTLNLSSLKYVKLPHTKKNVSSFGKTLCRTWKPRKPIIKCGQEQCQTVKRFDFSTPYSRT